MKFEYTTNPSKTWGRIKRRQTDRRRESDALQDPQNRNERTH